MLVELQNDHSGEFFSKKILDIEYEEFIKRLSIIQIPQEIHETYIEMKFHYWTLELEKNDPKQPLGYTIDYDNLNLISIIWKTDKPLIVVTHGYINRYDDQGAYSIKN
ncbi:uncharacterized protein LOC112686597, partial [Sipha flava]|uniref:Uncharacterized protein LOC112686597 n=1 Tax=Sipha flava TaxID=143950 RepID=A0A8B8FW72_9HEMI